MKQFLHLCFLPFAFCLLPFVTYAQATFHKVTVMSGTQTFGTVTVAVSVVGTPVGNGTCGITPYATYSPSSPPIKGWKFKFSSPVFAIQSHLISIGQGDTVGVDMNTNTYNITNANLSAYTPTASCVTTGFLNYAYNGYIVCAANPPSHPLVQFDAQPGYLIDSAFVYQISNGSSIGFDFYFAYGCGATLSALSNNPCLGDSLHLQANAIAGTTVAYSWAGPNSFSSASQNPNIANMQANGSGQYILTVTADSCTYHDTVDVVINTVPAIVSNSPLCAGDSLQLHASNNASGVSWQWAGPNSFADTLQNSGKGHIAFADSGYYTVTATLNGCAEMDSIFVQVKPVPNASIASSNSPLCSGDTLKLTVSPAVGGVNYQWSGPASYTATQQNPQRLNVQTSHSGTYKVVLNLNGCKDSTTTNVTVNATLIPTVSISSMPAIIPAGHIDTFTANTTNCSSPTYQWYRNGNAISGATSNPYITTLAANDHISVVVHCNGLCETPDSASSTSLSTTSVGNLHGSTGLTMTMWPNPVGDVLHVVANEDIRVNIIGVDGRMLRLDCFVPRNDPATAGQAASGVEVRELASGVYFVQVLCGDGRKETRRFIKQ